MSQSEEFEDLNTKIKAGTATQEEQARWHELKESLYAATKDGEDNRRHHRRKLPLEVSFANEEQLTRALCRDVGAGGLSLALPGEFEAGSTMELDLTLPGSTEPTRVKARIVWSAGGYTGLEFVDMDAATRDRIDALVWEDVDLSDL